jgi:hypothetical protein
MTDTVTPQERRVRMSDQKPVRVHHGGTVKRARRTRLIRTWILDDERLARIGCGKPVENSGLSCGKLALICGILVDRLPMLADREGRLIGSAAWIWREVLSYFVDITIADAERALAELAEEGYLIRFEARGAPFVQLTYFEEDQRPHKSEARSQIPSPGEAADGVDSNLSLFNSRYVTSRVTSRVRSRPGDTGDTGDTTRPPLVPPDNATGEGES